MAARPSVAKVGLVTNIIVSAPTSMIRLRSAWLSAEPAAPLIWVVSAVSRLITSPEWVRS
jgi:hypothetical protein